MSARRPGQVVARFCPSPTGTPHVGMARTALFNWAFARHHGGRPGVPDRGHRRRPQHRGVLPRADRRDGMARPGLGRGSAGRRADFGPYRQSERAEVYRDVAARLLAAGHLYESYSTADDVTARHVAAGRDPKLGYDNFDREAPASFVAAARAEGRPCGAPAADAGRRPLVRRPGARPDHLSGRFGAGPGDGARQRRTALHAGQPGGRRADGDHPCTARRGPAAVHPAADRAVPGDARGRHRIGIARGSAALRPPAVRDGPGQPQALQARSGVEPVPPPRRRIRPRGHGQLSCAAWFLDGRPGGVRAGGAGRRVRRGPGAAEPGAVRREEGGGDQRRPHPAARRPTISPPGWCRTCRPAARCRPTRPPTSWRCWPRPLRWCRSGRTC